MYRWFPLALLVAAHLTANVARAQAGASINATVRLSTTALTVANNADLDFGAVLPGTPASVDPRTSPTAGELEIHGARGAEIAVSFTLPAALTVGTHSMPIAFGATAGCHAPFFAFFKFFCQSFDPNSPLVVRLPNFNAPFNVRYVWLGGTVNPLPTQFPGIYQGTINVTVAYTGN